MNWFWKRVAQHLRAKLTIELVGTTEEALRGVLHSEAMEQLRLVESILFSEEMADEEKLPALQELFLRAE